MQTDPVSLAPCLTEKPLRRCQQQQSLKFKAFSVPLLLFLSFFFSPYDSLFLFSRSPPNICLKSQDVETPDGLGLRLGTWYVARISLHTKTRRGCDAATHTHTGEQALVLAVTQWQLEGGTNKNSSRCLNSPPLSFFHLVLSNLCFILPSSLHPSSFIHNCLHPPNHPPTRTQLLFLSLLQISLALRRPHQQKSSYSSHISGALGNIFEKLF